MNYSVSETEVDSVAVEIGGLPILLISEEASFQAMVRKQYPGFARVAESPGSGVVPLRLDVEVLNDGQLRTEEDVRVWKESDRWCARRGDFRAELDLAARTGRIRQELNPYALNSVLRIVHTLYLAREHGFLLHAASAIRGNSAFVFCGVSGSGKTTISRCAPADVVLLTDEISYIQRNGNGYRAWGTPFSGELGRPGENISAHLAKLFFLKQGPENRIESLQPAQAIRLLLRNVLFFSPDEELVEQVFDSACDFIQRIPAYRLTFVPDKSVWELVR